MDAAYRAFDNPTPTLLVVFTLFLITASFFSLPYSSQCSLELLQALKRFTQ